MFVFLTTLDQCGLSVPVPSTSGNRIVGGIVAQAGEFPWQVRLAYFPKFRIICIFLVPLTFISGKIAF